MNKRIYTVRNFPSYMINYCEYGYTHDLVKEDIKNYEEWLKDNNYEYYSCDTDTEEHFSSSVVFGLPANVTTAYFTKKSK